jgi:hypothetical protein
VLSFSDIARSDSSSTSGSSAAADALSQMKRVYARLDIAVRFAGLGVNVIRSARTGSSEVSMHNVLCTTCYMMVLPLLCYKKPHCTVAMHASE